jgi:hypothetical protein
MEAHAERAGRRGQDGIRGRGGRGGVLEDALDKGEDDGEQETGHGQRRIQKGPASRAGEAFLLLQQYMRNP